MSIDKRGIGVFWLDWDRNEKGCRRETAPGCWIGVLLLLVTLLPEKLGMEAFLPLFGNLLRCLAFGFLLLVLVEKHQNGSLFICTHT